jgi:hypothetical protein
MDETSIHMVEFFNNNEVGLSNYYNFCTCVNIEIKLAQMPLMMVDLTICPLALTSLVI